MIALLAAAVLSRPLILAHYMPWYQSKSVGGQWGWHWTMNHFNPDQPGSGGRQLLASKYRPRIGAYDSGDAAVLECQTLQMKTAGIDGVLIDWYGTKDLNDYRQIHANTQKMIDACVRAGLKFAIVMEDQVVPQLVKAGKSTPDEFAASAVASMKASWFGMSGYLKWNGKPVVMMFGPQYYKEAELNRHFGGDIAFFSLLGKKGPAVGAFGWPEPQVDNDKSWLQLQSFYARAKEWKASVPVAYPRFDDIYKEAGVGPGYGEIRDDKGATFKRTLEMAEASGAPFIQVATWNDWGEGTQIEPSLEFGYRDLEVIQAHRRKADPAFPYKPSHLRLPDEIYESRKAHKNPLPLDIAVRQILDGKADEAADGLKGSR